MISVEGEKHCDGSRFSRSVDKAALVTDLLATKVAADGALLVLSAVPATEFGPRAIFHPAVLLHTLAMLHLVGDLAFCNKSPT